MLVAIICTKMLDPMVKFQGAAVRLVRGIEQDMAAKIAA
jgi:hypothetical protein